MLELSSCEQRAIVTTNHKNKSHTISLRGTKNMKNVAQNLQLGTRPTGRAEDLEVPMHTGYRRIAQRCFEAFEPLIQKEGGFNSQGIQLWRRRRGARFAVSQERSQGQASRHFWCTKAGAEGDC